jgi:hypothetical protein
MHFGIPGWALLGFIGDAGLYFVAPMMHGFDERGLLGR